MDCFTQCAQHIKRLMGFYIAQNKTAGIWFIMRIIFYNFSRKYYLLDFPKRNFPAVTTPLCVPGNFIFSPEEFLPDLFKHQKLFIT